jgi:uncharacterized caspase-like protein
MATLLRWCALRCLGAALALSLAPAMPLTAQQTRGIAVTEERIALVIGNSKYAVGPLPNPVNDARLIAGALAQAGFKVAHYEDLDRNGMLNAVRDFGDRLNERTIAVMYYAGHALQLRDQNYLIPTDAEIRSEDEIPIAGMSVGFVLGRMSHARSRINIVILDACRNNPFEGSTGPRASGLAQIDAPVGTLLAYATAPGKVAEDGAGSNTLYTAALAKHLVTSGLSVESMFKRVREAVVNGSGGQQVPWESSSLLGEFAFVPGVAAAATSDRDVEAAGELAFWSSIQDSQRAEEYRAYLRQYPNGRFVELAKTRLAALATAGAVAQPAARPSALVAMLQAAGGRPSLLPQAGDTWRYRVQDQFRIGDLFLTATVQEVTPDGIAETWTTTSDAKVRTSFVPLEPGFHALPSWTLTPPEFAPYLQAARALAPGQKIGDQQRLIEQSKVPLKVSVVGEEEVAVAAGRFRATKVVLRGQTQTRGTRRGVSAEHVVWYAPDVKRVVKYTVSTRIGGALQEATVFELMEYRLN